MRTLKICSERRTCEYCSTLRSVNNNTRYSHLDRLQSKRLNVGLLGEVELPDWAGRNVINSLNSPVCKLVADR